jgi:pimeloyl-ACP methyl ester carboxylesterase
MAVLRYLALPWGRLACHDSGAAGTPLSPTPSALRTPRSALPTTLLLLHGTGCDSADWDATVAALPSGTRALGFDFRGHGDSDVPSGLFTIEDLASDILAAADALRLSRFVVAGHSLGGMVGLEMAARSDAVAGLVLFEGWTALRACAAFEGERFYGALDAAAVARIREKDALTRRRFDPGHWRRFWNSVEAFDATAFLARARIPIFEVYGGLGCTDATQERLLVPPNPQIRWRWIAGAGHYLPHERPAECAAICAECLMA